MDFNQSYYKFTNHSWDNLGHHHMSMEHQNLAFHDHHHLPLNDSLHFLTTITLHQPHPNNQFSPPPPTQPLPNYPAAAEDDGNCEPEEELGAMKEMMYKIAAMQPVDIDPATIRKPKRRNVRISDDPQSIAARHRRERISEKIRILQRLVPGGTKLDTASMLDEAVRYVKFLKRQIRLLQSNNNTQHAPSMTGSEVESRYGFRGGSSGDTFCFSNNEVISE